MRRVVLMAVGALAMSAGGSHALVGNSEIAPQGVATSVVMVLKQGGGGAGFCTGVALSRTAVLTAGHCAHGARQLAINVGAFGKPQLITVSDVTVHPEFVPDAARKRLRSIDLAILKLANSLPASVSIARLDSSSVVKPGQRYTVAGFGLTREGDERSAGQLRTGVLEAREPISKILLWARDPAAKGLGACTGDSGGPIFGADGSVTAITTWSTGEGKRSCGALTQGALVAPQRGWIDRALGGSR